MNPTTSFIETRLESAKLTKLTRYLRALLTTARQRARDAGAVQNSPSVSMALIVRVTAGIPAEKTAEILEKAPIGVVVLDRTSKK